MPRPIKKAAPAKAAKPSAAKKAAPKATAAKVPAKVPAKAVAGKATAVKQVTKKAVIAAPQPAPKAPPKPKPPSFSDSERATIREELLAQRATLERELEDLDAGSFNTSQSELSGEVSFDEEYADAGTFTFERERDLSLSNNIRDLMDKVDLAIRKIDNKTYGACERCGKGIEKARLKALPYSVLCIECKQREERVR